MKSDESILRIIPASGGSTNLTMKQTKAPFPKENKAFILLFHSLQTRGKFL